ncbi:SpoIIIAH-like family protein [Melghirimyces algeriensis]|uniref:Stage III sporulation protein AH n=1 Tax=Melghirimyces algeriensis TaxID=910412 RepID=A0A521AYV9_9BACL|nr:SpoIIIAH-like family protein [Melghirimyces algeriensis]SMO40027.1 stage III sporulation protein AH [Melghirimyces algeriensis]
MNMNKQTVWLVTMLTLMVVLSAYYIVTGPVEPADQITMDEQTSKSEDVQVKTKEKADKEEKDKKASVDSDSDYFIGYQLQRSSLRSKMTEKYMDVMTDPKASKEELKKAQQKINELMKVDKTESVMEDLIREEGFRDAVVITNEDDFVDVIVQSEKMSKKQVVKLISMVKKQLDVPVDKISIAYKN